MAFNLSGILSLDNNPFIRGLKQSESASNRFGSTVKGAASSVKGLVGAAASIAGSIGIAKLAKDSIMLASDLTEVQNVVDTTFKGASSEIDKFAKTSATSFGISELEAKKFSGTLGAMMKSSKVSGKELTKMSKDLTGLSGDMASFYNLQPEEAFDKLKSAISGETEPMKALGVNMSVVNMETFALTKGIKKQWKEMSQAEQTTLRYQYIMEATKDAQGDFNKTQGTFANQLKIAQLNLKTLGANMAQGLIPYLNKGLTAFNSFITSIQDSSTPIGAFASKMMDNLIPVMKSAKDFIMIELVPRFQSIGTTMAELYTTYAPALSGVFDALKETASTLVTTGLDLVNSALTWIKDNEGVVTDAINNIKGGFQLLTDLISGDFNAAWETAKQLTADIIKNLNDIINLAEVSDSKLARIAGGGIKAYIPGLPALGEKGETSQQMIDRYTKNSQKNASLAKDFIKSPSLNTFADFMFGAKKKNANGTSYFSGGASMINERGGEMQILRNGTSVIPADRTKQMIEKNGSDKTDVRQVNIYLDSEKLTSKTIDFLANNLELVLTNM